MEVFWALWKLNRDSSCYVHANTEIFTDKYGKNNMSDILPSASGEKFMGKKLHSLEWNSPFSS
jgi:hypothetical protein